MANCPNLIKIKYDRFKNIASHIICRTIHLPLRL